MLHEEREGKEHEPLLEAFEELTANGVVRVERLYLRKADLSGLRLTGTNLLYSDFTGACLTNSRFTRVGFDRSTLDDVQMDYSVLTRVDLRSVHGMRKIHWYGAILDGLRLPDLPRLGLRCVYDQTETMDPERAEYTYRALKEAYKGQGRHDEAAALYEREMDMKRHRASFFDKLWLTLLWLVCGYGERPLRLTGVFAAVITAFALGYSNFGLVGPDGPITGDFFQSLYFSIVTFTSLGYGEIRPVGFARLLAGTEAVLGVFLSSLFVFVFCRRMVR
ncbi:MAG: ion channel [Myxococcota bacterium]|nr:ion channel [Myxococcota bacterium]